MTSIRRTLSIWLLSTILLAGMFGALIIYRNTMTEADEFFDYQLRQAALLLRDQAFEAALPPQFIAEADAYDIVVQVWSPNGTLAYQSQPHSSLPALTALGLATASTDAGQWRTYGIQSHGYVIQVAQPIAVRRAQAVRLSVRTLVPFVIVMPALALIMLLVVPHTLGPLRRAAAALLERSPTDLRPIDMSSLPAEVRPLLSAFNELLVRLGDTLEREQTFIADAAHELRTPVTALRLQVDNLNAAQDEAGRRAATHQLDGGVARMGRLIEQLLSMARLRSRGPELRAPIKLDELARDVVADKTPLADAKQVDLGITVADPCSLRGDAVALRVLLGNLIDNAIHYTPHGGRVDVSLVADSHCVELRVTDTGPGIPPEEREHVFRRFYRATADSSPTPAAGSGLGLAIAKSAAQQHGATIELADGPGGTGLSVVVRFPARSDAGP